MAKPLSFLAMETKRPLLVEKATRRKAFSTTRVSGAEVEEEEEEEEEEEGAEGGGEDRGRPASEG
jgi:hypothetical protein